MKSVILRSISGIVYVALLTGAVLAGGAWLEVLLSLLCVIGIYEFTSMTCEGKYPRIATAVDIAAGICLILSSYLYCTYNNYYIALFVAFLSLVMAREIGQLYSRHLNPVSSIARSLMAQIYISLPLALLNILYAMAHPHIVLAILIFIWVNDTGAFCVGCTCGRHKLFERISPKKTWEGFFGGMAFCIVAAVLMCGCFSKFFYSPDYFEMCRLAVVVSIFATFGDLFESLIKRSCNVKDSGNIIPGHGGILDRIDSLLFVIPATTILVIICAYI